MNRVLVAEHDEFWREKTREILEDEGWVVDAVENYAKTVVALKAERYDVVILDMTVIGSSEEDIFNIVRSLQPGQTKLLVTAESGIMTAQLGVLIAASRRSDGEVYKPFSSSELLSAIYGVKQR